MGLKERAEAAIKRRGSTCVIRLLQLADDEREELMELLADPAMPGSAIARALADDGHHVTGLSIQRHRRGDCQCPR